MEIAKTILRNLLKNQEYTRKILPFLQPDYFQEDDKRLFDTIRDYVVKYNAPPTIEAVSIEISEKSIPEAIYKKMTDTLNGFRQYDMLEPLDDWLVDKTEKFCQDRALHLALLESIEIMDGKGKKEKGAIPDLLTKALGITFDASVGHDYLEDFAERFEYYHEILSRLPFDLDYFNKITNGGLPNKTLTVLIGGVNVGKTLCMCHIAASMLLKGKNVLYITLEMAEKEISKRIDANIMDVDINTLNELPEAIYNSKIGQIKSKTAGKLIVHEYPTTTAGVLQFKALLNELYLKKNFKPDIIVVDYLNICMSSRYKLSGGNVNSYTYVKAIAEEFRGLAVEYDVPVLTATQFTRSGSVDTDPDMTDTSESFGLPATADLMLAIVSTDELAENNLYMVKQLKNRLSDVTKDRKFVIGVDRTRMRLFDVKQVPLAESNQTEDKPKNKFDKPQSKNWKEWKYE